MRGDGVLGAFTREALPIQVWPGALPGISAFPACQELLEAALGAVGWGQILVLLRLFGSMLCSSLPWGGSRVPECWKCDRRVPRVCFGKGWSGWQS